MRKTHARKIREEQNLRDAAEDFENLRAEGYEIQEFTPWHFRISMEEFDIAVDVWPTQMKRMLTRNRTSFSAVSYGSLFREVQAIFRENRPE